MQNEFPEVTLATVLQENMKGIETTDLPHLLVRQNIVFLFECESDWRFQIFQREISNAHSRHDLLGAVDNFMGCSTVLPPGEWNPTIRIEPPAKVESHEMRMSKKRAREGEQSAITQEAHESHGSDIKRTGR